MTTNTKWTALPGNPPQWGLSGLPDGKTLLGKLPKWKVDGLPRWKTLLGKLPKWKVPSLSEWKVILAGLLKKRATAVVALSLSLTLVIGVAALFTKVVTVNENGKQWTLLTLSTDYDSILSQSGCVTGPRDKVVFSGFNGNSATLTVYHPISVNVIDAGKATTYIALDNTVGEVLTNAGIDLRDNDLINIPLSEKVTGEDILITRIDEGDVVEEIVLPYTVTYKDSPLVKPGATYLISSGKNGKKVSVYHEVYKDGVLTQRTLVNEYVESAAVNEVVLRGVKTSAPISELTPPSYLTLDANGVPTSYKRLIGNATATAYSAREGAKGASGLYCVPGIVAVNAKEIPYGTEMYITSTDGKVVYGYAIAGDTGAFALYGRVDVDLFFGSYLESCQWGLRGVNIYILR